MNILHTKQGYSWAKQPVSTRPFTKVQAAQMTEHISAMSFWKVAGQHSEGVSSPIIFVVADHFWCRVA